MRGLNKDKQTDRQAHQTGRHMTHSNSQMCDLKFSHESQKGAHDQDKNGWMNVVCKVTWLGQFPQIAHSPNAFQTLHFHKPWFTQTEQEQKIQLMIFGALYAPYIKQSDCLLGTPVHISLSSWQKPWEASGGYSSYSAGIRKLEFLRKRKTLECTNINNNL
jgi:hypothetical protein